MGYYFSNFTAHPTVACTLLQKNPKDFFKNFRTALISLKAKGQNFGYWGHLW